MNLMLVSRGEWYNPHTLFHSLREVKEIVLFDEGGPVYQFKWFCDEKECRSGSNRSLEFGIELKRKAKEDWSVDFAYWIPKKKELYQRHDDRNYAVLYIPLSKCPITEVASRVIDFETARARVITYMVEGLEVYFENGKDMKPSKRNKAMEEINKLIDESVFAQSSYDICHNFSELKALVAKIEELDKSVRGGVLS